MSKLEGKEKRPLYAAMRKYGIEHFHISLIEETYKPEERERYWIEYFSSFKNGYNATQGGDGKSYLDISELLRLWNSGKTITEISNIVYHDKGWISSLLKENGITQEQILERGAKASLEACAKRVEMLDKKTEEVLASFDSTREAARFLIKERGLNPGNEGGYSTHISNVCQGKRKTCQGYKWRYNHS